MQNQESMFEKSEPTPAQPINVDSREQTQRRETPPAEGNEEGRKEYSEGYSGGPVYEEPWQAEGEKLRPRQQPRIKKRSSLKPLVIAVLIIALIVGWGGMSSGRFIGGEKTLPAQVFTISSAPTLVLNNGNGDVHIHAGNVNSVVVSARERGFGMQNENSRPVETEQTGNTVTINSTERSGMFDGRVDLDITVPSATNLELHTNTGDIELEGVNGQVTLTTNSGDIKGDNLSGAFTLKTNSGDVELKQSTLQGDSSFRSDSGTIDFEGSLASQGSYQFQTNSGDVKLKLPESSTFHLNPSTHHGDIKNDFKQAENSSASGPQVNIVTNNGDISVRSQND